MNKVVAVVGIVGALSLGGCASAWETVFGGADYVHGEAEQWAVDNVDDLFDNYGNPRDAVVVIYDNDDEYVARGDVVE